MGSSVWRRIGRRSLIVALGLGLGAGSLVMATSAPAAADPVTITTTDGGAVAVHVSASALWVQATIRVPEAAGGSVLLQTDHFVYDNAGYWRSEDAVHLPDGSGYGDYPVDVDYRLPADPQVTHVLAAGLFSYRMHIGITDAAFDRTATDYDHRTATLTGTATIFDPVAQTSGPAGAGFTVRVMATGLSGNAAKALTTDVVTDAAGGFAAPLTPGGHLIDGTARIVIDPASPDAETTVPVGPVALSDVDVTSTRVRIVGAPAHARVHSGHAFRVSGTVQRLTATSGWRPLVGAPVVTTVGDPDYWHYTTPGLIGSGVSDAAGHFSYYAKARRTATFSTYARFSDYVTASVVGGSVSVPVKAGYSTPTIRIDAYRDVTATSYLRGPCGHQLVQLQYSRSGRSGWTRIGQAYSDDKYDNHSCRVSLTGYGSIDGYYRLAHAESDELLAFSSGARHLHRIATKTSFSISPKRPNSEAPLRATGKVTQLVKGKWVALRHARVVLVYRPKGDTSWYWVVKGWTSSSGAYVLKGKAYGDGSWAAYYSPDAKHFYSQAKPIYVNVR